MRNRTRGKTCRARNEITGSLWVSSAAKAASGEVVACGRRPQVREG
jgi:hypothetical protein